MACSFAHLRPGVSAAVGRGKATIFGRNVFNMNFATAVSTHLDRLLRYKGRPATSGISLQYNYGN